MNLREGVEAVINILVEDTIDRERLNNIVTVKNYKDLLSKSKSRAIDRILSLPVEGVEVKEKCKCEGGFTIDGSSGMKDCPDCQGTGTIRKTITLQELIDLAKQGRVVVK